LRSRSLRSLFALEWGELVASRAFWLFLLAIGPLGIGAGMPATLIMALGAGVLWRDRVTRIAVVELVTVRSDSYPRAA